jgi:hypothetical protein
MPCARARRQQMRLRRRSKCAYGAAVNDPMKESSGDG